jgi:mono/diheme cytochrome c family protein
MPDSSRSRSFGLVITFCLLALLLRTSLRAHAQDQNQLEQGARLFAENCAVCHGANGEGRVGATLAKDWPSIRPDLEVRMTIENGITGSPMPPWSMANGGPLTSQEIDALVAYVLSWQTGGPRPLPPTPSYAPRPVVTAPPNVVGDPNQGGVLFDMNCVVCHGTHGEGRVGAQLAKAWVSIRPDLSIKETISNGVQGSPMPAWSQANGGPLTETEIDNLVAFVLTLQPAGNAAQAQPTPAPLPGPLANAFGVLLTLVLLIGIVWLAIVLQTRGKRE